MISLHGNNLLAFNSTKLFVIQLKVYAADQGLATHLISFRDFLCEYSDRQIRKNQICLS